MKEAAAGNDFCFHPRLRAEDARQMFRLRTGEHRGCFIPARQSSGGASSCRRWLHLKSTAFRGLSCSRNSGEWAQSPRPARVLAIYRSGMRHSVEPRFFLAQNTKGNALSVPLLSVAFWVVRSVTFSLRPSWRSSWLPSSLVSWLLSWLPFSYSPFSMGCIDSAIRNCS